jgi:hypothetical protein
MMFRHRQVPSSVAERVAPTIDGTLRINTSAVNVFYNCRNFGARVGRFERVRRQSAKDRERSNPAWKRAKENGRALVERGRRSGGI